MLYPATVAGAAGYTEYTLTIALSFEQTISTYGLNNNLMEVRSSTSTMGLEDLKAAFSPAASNRVILLCCVRSQDRDYCSNCYCSQSSNNGHWRNIFGYFTNSSE